MARLADTWPRGQVLVLVPSGIVGGASSIYAHLMKSKPAENIEALGKIVEELCKQVERMTAHQKEELLAELYDYYLDKPPRWLN